MSDSRKKFKGKPLEPKEIKRVLFERDTTIAALAREASDDLGREVTAWQMRAVIYRFAGVVYQDVREWLAKWLGCDVSQVGRDPLPRKINLSETSESASAA